MELFFERKSELKNVMLILIKDLKAGYGVHRSFVNKSMLERRRILKECKQEGMGVEF